MDKLPLKTLTNTPAKTIRIASRGSMLALWQARYVAQILNDHGAQTEILVIKTTGDRVQDRFLHEIGGKGLFVKELEQALLEEKADLAVHSLKDMPVTILKPLSLAAVLKRHSPADLLIFGPKLKDQLSSELNRQSFPTGEKTPTVSPDLVKKIPPGSVVATGSLRRISLFAAHAPDLKTAPVRGNVDSRLAKLAKGEYDALVLAEASLDRLGLKDQSLNARLDPQWFIPCASQGALAIECHENSPFFNWVRKVLNDPATEHAVSLERRLLALLGGDCTMPFGCYAAQTKDSWLFKAGLYTQKGEMATAQAQIAPPHFTTNDTDQPLQHVWIDSHAQAMLAPLEQGGAPRILKSLGLTPPLEWH